MYNPSRTSWIEHAMLLAKAASLRSEDPYKKVGACALDRSNMVLGVSYNGLASGKNVEESFWSDRPARLPYMIHAEVNLLSMFKRGDAKIIACTLSPCMSCAQMIAAYGVEEVYYGEVYKRDDRGLDVFDFYGIKHSLFDMGSLPKI